ncbi:cytidylyltransferase domain-containing protein [Peribacillus frigoritolerans]|uniref:acylneuraminate cytidylyltransferase family protein n=1 Tax=Peribacillus frigoritolerans TaxID=450367 RepID=UPI00207AECD6|nr:acylneuraminate cytidylyltransferase family protein [Peribacillus frigoritolerans]USK72891.1 acylneuraminate cytidylyltransferase family protein [Peribacillus frigoritolerans]
MYKGEKIIALVPARGGSKAVPYKNIKLLFQKPLIAWTLELVKEMPEIDKVVVSTDDANISIISQYFGAEVIMRPNQLSGDDSLAIDTVKHAINVLKEQKETYDIMLYLQPTSPLRKKEDIYDCLELLIENNKGYTSVATFSEADLNPIRAWFFNGTSPQTFIKNANPFLPRQMLPKAYQLNGSIYAFYTKIINDETEKFLGDNPGGIIIPKERGIDMDEEIDFMLAEKFFERKLNE